MEPVKSLRHFGVAVALAMICTVAAGFARADDKPADAPPQQTKATAVDAAKDYTQRMKSDDPATAVRTYWDLDSMLAGIFGEHLRRHGDEERAEMKRLLLAFIENVYATPTIAAAMKQAIFEDFKAEENTATGTTAVSFNVRIQSTVIPNSLHMKSVDGNWKIVDAGTNGRMMVPSIRSQYDPQAQRLAPLDYIKAMVAKVPGAQGKPAGPRKQ